MMKTDDKQTIYHIAVPSPLRRLFDYLPPLDSQERNKNQPLQPGTRVFIPFGKRELVGIIVASSKKSSISLSRLKSIISVIDSESLIPEYLFKLYVWAAKYYQYPIGDALFHSIPGLLRKGKDLPTKTNRHWRLVDQGVKFSLAKLSRSPRQQEFICCLQQEKSISQEEAKQRNFSASTLKQLEEKKLIILIDTPIKKTQTDIKAYTLAEKPQTLYPEQKKAVNNIKLNGFNAYLLFGETGSGKTEVYLQTIEKIVCSGKQALILIPEINLTPQTLGRFKRRFNCHIVVLNSKLTDREKAFAWNSARTGQASIILGTRSAIFTPLKSPGLLIVDEEHDSSYKQQEGYRYSARDLAVIRAKKESIPIILGSATPSLESLNNCEENRYTKLILSSRAGEASRPIWIPVDIKKTTLIGGYSQELIDAIKKTLSEGDQVLIFLNRRGYSPTLSCYDCGWISNCPNCEARLTVHRKPNRLICHHCEHMKKFPSKCPFCDGSKLECIGQGTERSEDTLKTLFPYTQILRVDRDTTRRKSAMNDLLSIINKGNPCILIGTQMLAKGHHFPKVTLVAILDADGGLFSPDFRAPEKMGQLITQVAGRSGRGEKPGSVVIQSNHCEHPFIATLMSKGYQSFIKIMFKERKLCNLPPYRFMAIIRSESVNSRAAINFLKHCRQYSEYLLPPNKEINYLGPLPAAMEKRNGRFRYILSIYCKERKKLQWLMEKLCLKAENSKLAKRVRWSVDVDPQDVS